MNIFPTTKSMKIAQKRLTQNLQCIVFKENHRFFHLSMRKSYYIIFFVSDNVYWMRFIAMT